MSVVQPWALLGLLALPALWWIHLHVTKSGTQRVISNVDLWVDPSQTAGEGRQRDRLPITKPLVFESLALIALVLAMAGPLLGPTYDQRRVVGVVIDGSASMGGGEADAAPVNQILQRLEQLSDEPLFRVVISGPTPRFLASKPLTLEQLEVRLQAHQFMAPSHDLAQATAMLEMTGIANHELLLFSDSALSHAQAVQVGDVVGNVGIVTADWRVGRAPFVVVRRFGGAASAPSTLAIRYQENGAVEQQLAVDLAQGELPFELTVPTSVNTLYLSLTSTDEDALGLDNEVVLQRSTMGVIPARVSVSHAKAKRRLQRLMRVVPRFGVGAAGEAGVLVTDRAVPASKDYQMVFAGGASGAKRTLVSQFNGDSFAPLMQGVDFKGLRWFATPQQAPAGAKVLLRGAGSQANIDLIWQTPTALKLNIDLQRSNLLDHPALPLMTFNLAEFLSELRGGLPESNFRLGQALNMWKPAAWPTTVRVIAPDNSAREFETLLLAYGSLVQQGLYRIVDSQGVELARFSANLADVGESDLTARRASEGLPVATAKAESEAKPDTRIINLLIILAVLCLFAAWYYLSNPRVLKETQA